MSKAKNIRKIISVIVLPIILGVLIFYFVVKSILMDMSNGYTHGKESDRNQLERIGIIVDSSNQRLIDSVIISKHDIFGNSYSMESILSDVNGRFKIVVSSTDSLIYFWKEGYEYFSLNINENYTWDTIYMDKKE